MGMIIGLGYKAGVGKDTVADILVRDHGFERIGFADTVKEACRAIFNFTDNQLFTQEGKMREDPFWGFAPRTAMQAVGAGLRNGLTKDIWVRALQVKLRDIYNDKDVVIADVRYANEIDMIKKMNGFLVHVVREGKNNLNASQQVHESEVELDDFTGWDYTIHNNGAIDDLPPIIMDMLAEYAVRDCDDFSETSTHNAEPQDSGVY